MSTENCRPIEKNGGSAPDQNICVKGALHLGSFQVSFDPAVSLHTVPVNNADQDDKRCVQLALNCWRPGLLCCV